MSSRTQILIPAGLSLLVLGYMSVFYVKEHEKAILFRLGEMVESDYKPGLHFKAPSSIMSVRLMRAC